MKRKKRFLKISALVGCILLGVGILMTAGGFAAMGFDLRVYNQGRPTNHTASEEEPSRSVEGGVTWEEVEFSPDDAITSIQVTASLGDVTIQGADVQAPTLRYCPERNRYRVEDGTLIVEDWGTEKTGWRWYQLVHFWEDPDQNVTLLVPEKLLKSVDVESGMGSVNLSVFQVEELTVEASTGSVVVEQVSAAKSMNITQSMGMTTVKDCQGGTLTVGSDMGSAEVITSSFTAGEITSGSGNVGVAESGFTALTVENDMGDVHLNSTQVSHKVSCGVGMGSIVLESLASPDITLTSDMGDVEGTIAGRQEDYQISVDTDMGDSNLKDQITNGPNFLKVTTGMGSIQLDFQN